MIWTLHHSCFSAQQEIASDRYLSAMRNVKLSRNRDKTGVYQRNVKALKLKPSCRQNPNIANLIKRCFTQKKWKRSHFHNNGSSENNPGRNSICRGKVAACRYVRFYISDGGNSPVARQNTSQPKLLFITRRIPELIKVRSSLLRNRSGTN